MPPFACQEQEDNRQVEASSLEEELYQVDLPSEVEHSQWVELPSAAFPFLEVAFPLEAA